MAEITDKDRLNWLAKGERGRHILPAKGKWLVRKEVSETFGNSTILGRFNSLRKAIDFAMKKIRP